MFWELIILGTLFAYIYYPPYWLAPYLPIPTEAAQNNYQTTQQEVKLPINKTKETLLASNYYQGIRINREDLISYLEVAFTKYGIADQIPIAKEVISCESGFRINADNGISYGILQFTKPTWQDFGHGDIFNPFVQIDTTAKMVKMGLWNRWDCWRMQEKTSP